MGRGFTCARTSLKCVRAACGNSHRFLKVMNNGYRKKARPKRNTGRVPFKTKDPEGDSARETHQETQPEEHGALEPGMRGVRLAHSGDPSRRDIAEEDPPMEVVHGVDRANERGGVPARRAQLEEGDAPDDSQEEHRHETGAAERTKKEADDMGEPRTPGAEAGTKPVDRGEQGHTRESTPRTSGRERRSRRSRKEKLGRRKRWRSTTRTSGRKRRSRRSRRKKRKTENIAKHNEDRQRNRQTELDRGEEDGEQGREQEQEERKEVDQNLESEERQLYVQGQPRLSCRLQT